MNGSIRAVMLAADAVQIVQMVLANAGEVNMSHISAVLLTLAGIAWPIIGSLCAPWARDEIETL